MEDVTIPGEQLGEELRITTGVTARMLGAGWLLYLASIILNFIFYKMHPSSPEMWTWGAEEELEEWTPADELEKKEAEGEFDVQTWELFNILLFLKREEST